MRPNIIICAAPKSGSSHIKISLQRLLGYRSAYMTNDNVINPSTAQLILGSFDEQIFHHHIGATPCNLSILKRYKDESRVIVTIRNVLDTLVSLKDHLDNYSSDRWHTGPGCSGDSWHSLSTEARLRWAVYNSTPWYFSFYVLWSYAAVPKLFVKYEDFFKDQVVGIRRILDFVGVDQEEYGNSIISKITGFHDGRFNVGRAGRGREILSQELIDVVYGHADSWGPYWGKKIREELLDG